MRDPTQPDLVEKHTARFSREFMAQSDAHVIVNHRFICVYEFYTRLGDIEIFTILSCMDSALIVLTGTHTQDT